MLAGLAINQAAINGTNQAYIYPNDAQIVANVFGEGRPAWMLESHVLVNVESSTKIIANLQLAGGVQVEFVTDGYLKINSAIKGDISIVVQQAIEEVIATGRLGESDLVIELNASAIPFIEMYHQGFNAEIEIEASGIGKVVGKIYLVGEHVYIWILGSGFGKFHKTFRPELKSNIRFSNKAMANLTMQSGGEATVYTQSELNARLGLKPEIQGGATIRLKSDCETRLFKQVYIGGKSSIEVKFFDGIGKPVISESYVPAAEARKHFIGAF